MYHIIVPFSVPGRTASRLRRCHESVARLVQESPLESLAHHRSQGTRRTVLHLPRKRAPCGGRKQGQSVRERTPQNMTDLRTFQRLLHAQPKPDAVLLERWTSVRLLTMHYRKTTNLGNQYDSGCIEQQSTNEYSTAVGEKALPCI
jgi:hypothetical protein